MSDDNPDPDALEDAEPAVHGFEELRLEQRDEDKERKDVEPENTEQSRL